MATKYTFAFCALFPLAVSAAESPCPRPAGLDALSCVASTHAWVYADDVADARLLAEDLDASAAQFQRHFQRSPPQLAVVLGPPERTLADADKNALNVQGAALAFTWPGLSAHADMARTGMQADGPAARALAAHPQLQQTIWRNVTRHELGHVVFTLGFWPGTTTPRGHGHAASPDWLNEMAAMLQEPETAADHRRRMLSEHLLQPDTQALPTLDQLLSMRNPARPPDDQPAPSRSGVALVYRGDAPRPGQQASALYYAQVQGLADYLQDAEAEGTIASLATAIADGRSFKDWLANSGPAQGLPATMEALETDWRAWLSRPRR